jgi:hypothetical protein
VFYETLRKGVSLILVLSKLEGSKLIGHSVKCINYSLVIEAWRKTDRFFLEFQNASDQRVARQQLCNTVQYAKIEESVFSVDPTDAPID